MLTPDTGRNAPTQVSENNDQELQIDVRDLLRRLSKGVHQIIAFTLLGISIAVILFLAFSRFTTTATGTKVAFNFQGFEKGEYPDKSKFQAEDLRAPTIVKEALRRQGLDTSDDFQSRIRGALSIEGAITPEIVKERDRLRAIGQVPPPFIPDEYHVTLNLPRSTFLSNQQREKLLHEIVIVFRENFQRTYAEVPLAFGNAFAALNNADFPEYDLILTEEVQSIIAYLTGQEDQAKTFRSRTTNLTFRELIEQTQLFSQLKLNETLGLIRENGLSRNRRTAMVKMDYYLRILESQETYAAENEKVVRDLLIQTQERQQNYVLGVKSQAAKAPAETTVLDQGLIDSLLANDASNFLIRQALDAGLKVKSIQAQKARLVDQRENMKSFLQSDIAGQTAAIAQAKKSLAELETGYNGLIEQIRLTENDFRKQQFADCVQFTDEVRSSSLLKPLVIAAALGGLLGLTTSIALSVLGIYVHRRS